MKTRIFSILVMLMCVMLCSCGEQKSKIDIHSTALSPEQAKKLGRPPIDPKKDYSADVSGMWMWINKDGKYTVGMGGFSFVETDKGISGDDIFMTERIRPIYKRGGNEDFVGAMKVLQVKGHRDKAGQIHFDVMLNNKVIVTNVAVLLDKGGRMMGVSTPAKINGKQGHQITTTWEAVRISG